MRRATLRLILALALPAMLFGVAPSPAIAADCPVAGTESATIADVAETMARCGSTMARHSALLALTCRAGRWRCPVPSPGRRATPPVTACDG
jgi:hypothetical protein